MVYTMIGQDIDKAASLNYYRNQRRSLSDHILEGANLILDVGCGAGHFGAYLKESGKASKVFGIELIDVAAREASTMLDKVVCADLDSCDFQAIDNQFDNTRFDYIVCADVLEHVKNPWTTLDELTKYLKPDGKLIVSIPNIRHWKILYELIACGRWDYVDAGILDRTHIRFFTKSTAKELLHFAGYKVTVIKPLIGGHWLTLSKLMFKAIDEFLAIQYVFVAERK